MAKIEDLNRFLEGHKLRIDPQESAKYFGKRGPELRPTDNQSAYDYLWTRAGWLLHLGTTKWGSRAFDFDLWSTNEPDVCWRLTELYSSRSPEVPVESEPNIRGWRQSQPLLMPAYPLAVEAKVGPVGVETISLFIGSKLAGNADALAREQLLLTKRKDIGLLCSFSLGDGQIRSDTPRDVDLSIANRGDVWRLLVNLGIRPEYSYIFKK